MGGFNFDFSQMNPYITGMMDRSLRAMDYNLGQQPKRDSMNDRAYAEWLNNNASKRGIAEDDARMRRTGFDASQALAGRMEKEAANARAAAERDKRLAYMAAMGAASQPSIGGSTGSLAGAKRDFYTYGPYKFGGQGNSPGGGNARGEERRDYGLWNPNRSAPAYGPR